MDIRIRVEEKKSRRCVYIPISHTSYPNHIEEHEERKILFITEHDFVRTVISTLEFWSTATYSFSGTRSIEIMKNVELSEESFDQEKHPLVAIPLDSRCIIRHTYNGLAVWIPVYQYIPYVLNRLARTKILHLNSKPCGFGGEIIRVFRKAWTEKIAELEVGASVHALTI